MEPAFQGLIENSVEDNPFTFEKEGSFGTALANAFTLTEPDNLRALLFGQDGSVIDTFGGEWEFDHFKAILHKSRGADNGVTIRYGKNLTDLKQEENIQSTYTGICPYWKGQEEDGVEEVVYLPEKVLHSTSAENYPYQRTKIVDFSSEFETAPTTEELRARGEKYIESNDIGTPTVSLDVSFIALHQTQEYSDMTRTYRINLCDTVTVLFPALNVSTKAKVVKTVYNVLLDRYDSITIGEIQSYLSATLAQSQESAVEKAVALTSSATSADYVTKTTFNSLSGAVGNAQRDIYSLQDFENAINGTLGGYVAITVDENKQTDCLYILIDSPVLDAAKKVLRWNEEGLCYTEGGIRKGTFITLVTPDGKLSAEVMTGLLKDVNENSWNLETGEVNLPADTSFEGKSIATLVGELMPDVSGALNTAIKAYDEGLNQEAILKKLNDDGFYLGEDGLLHMLQERIIEGGLNVPVMYLPTTIVDGVVTSFVKARVENGVIYPALSSGEEIEDVEDIEDNMEEEQ
jgi:phage-related protein